jgi:hypothetical protein
VDEELKGQADEDEDIIDVTSFSQIPNDKKRRRE